MLRMAYKHIIKLSLELFYPLGEITSRGCPEDIPKRGPIDVLCSPLCNVMVSPRLTS